MRLPIPIPVTLPFIGGETRSYDGARCLVTGGCSGLGLELARLLAADGAQVLVVDVHDSAPDGVLPEGVEYRRLDVRDDDGWAETLAWVELGWGGLDLLVNNAGIAVGGRIDHTSMDDWERIVSINLLGVVRGTRTFVPMMKAQGSGQIVSTASIAGLIHPPAMAAYNSVKAGVVALSETLRAELAPFGIEVSVICPAFFRTGLADSLAGSDAAMEVSARDLIDKAPRSAATVAKAAFDGMKAGRHIILTDADGEVAYRAKRFARPLYDAAMTSAGQRVAKGESPLPDLLDRLRRSDRSAG